MKLGVNIDHIATLREARKGVDPDPVHAAVIAQAVGVDAIVAHLREDRRHIKESDLVLLKKFVTCKLNMEMSLAGEIVGIALRIKPDQVTLVPEKRQELTTEGGLDVVANSGKISSALKRFNKYDIDVSLFIDPAKKQIDAAKNLGIKFIELHTGKYADAADKKQQSRCLQEIKQAAKYAKKIGFRVYAGHGLNYNNVALIAGIKEIEELNIGHSIISRSVLVGLDSAIRQMKALIK